MPPFAGAFQETWSTPASLDDAEGGDACAGIVVTVIVFDAADAEEVPLAFVAVTVKL